MKLTEFIGITTRNMHVKFEAVRRSYNFWWKNAYSADPSKQDEILRFSQCSPKFMTLKEFIEITTRNMHVKFEAVWRATIFDRKIPSAPDLQNRMKFWDFLNVLQYSWNLQKLLESPPETCMWNLRQLGEVTIFDGKYLQRRTFKTGWNFDFFSMFSKIHETYRIYWNHHQKHACEIWGSSEKLQFLTEKCPQRRTFKTGWNLDIFSMFSIIHETYRSYWNHHQKPCMWNLRQFGEVTIFDRKMPTAPTLKNRMKFRYFLNVLHNSWNLQKLLESPPETCMWNLRQFREVTIFDRKMPTVPDLQNRMKFWHFLNVLQNSWNLQNLLESPPETCM